MSLPHNSSNQFPSLKVYKFLGTRIALDGTLWYDWSPITDWLHSTPPSSSLNSYDIQSEHRFYTVALSRPSDLELIVLSLYGTYLQLQPSFSKTGLYVYLCAIPYHSMMILLYHTIPWCLWVYSIHTMGTLNIPWIYSTLIMDILGLIPFYSWAFLEHSPQIILPSCACGGCFSVALSLAACMNSCA